MLVCDRLPVARRQCLFSMTNHTALVTAVKWGGEGLIYSASRDKMISCWEVSMLCLAARPGLCTADWL